MMTDDNDNDNNVIYLFIHLFKNYIALLQDNYSEALSTSPDKKVCLTDHTMYQYMN